jgi:putative endonuclease
VGLLYFRSLKHFYVYIIQSELDNSFYKGFTTNYLDRLDEHNLGFSDYTSRKRPWKLVYVEEFPSKTEALKKEIRLKKQNTKYILWPNSAAIKSSSRVNAALSRSRLSRDGFESRPVRKSLTEMWGFCILRPFQNNVIID